MYICGIIYGMGEKLRIEKTMDVAHIYWGLSNYVELSKKLVKHLELNSLSELMRTLLVDAAFKQGLIENENYQILKTLALGKAGALKRSKK